jgi:hypothetical protein
MVRKIMVAKGIGDVSWVWSKLINVTDQIEFCIPKGYPERTLPWCKLLPELYGSNEKAAHNFRDIRLMRLTRPYVTWVDVLKQYGDEPIYLECNDHLIAGHPLAEFLPDLPTNYHYPINTTEEHKAKAGAFLLPAVGRYTLGIHCANIVGARAWKAWLPEDWVEFIKCAVKDIPNLTVVFLGGYWDIPTAAEVIGRYGKELSYIDLTGKTDIGTVIEVLKGLNYYIGFSSGLNVLANVINKPCMALWPDWQDSLKYSWADPETIDNRTYLASVYDEPERIYYRMKSVLPNGT